VPVSKVGSELPFDVISTAYERTSLIVTTNLPLESWTEVLGSERLTGGTLDRLTHRCRIIETKGESYRLQDAKARTSRPRDHQTYRRDPNPELTSRDRPVAVFDQRALPFSIIVHTKRGRLTGTGKSSSH
jgi:IstB-like ATP binding protein